MEPAATPGAGRRPSLAQVVAIGAIPIAAAVLTAVLGLHRIGERAFWHDEAFSVDAVRDGWAALATFITTQEVNMATYYAALRAWMTFGDSDAWTRSLSVVFAVASVVAMYALARLWLGPRVALWAALLLAVNAFVIEYAQEARTYTLVLFLSMASTALLIRSLRDGAPAWWIAYVIAASALAWAHVVALGLLVVHGVLVATARPRPSVRSLIVVATGLAIGIGPVLVLAAGQAEGLLPWISPPTVGGLISGWTRLIGAGAAETILPAALGPIAGVWPVVAAGLAVIGLAAGLRDPDRRRDVLVLVAWILVPVALGLLVSVVKPIIVVRYFIYLIPAMVLLVALGIEAIPARRARILVGVLAVGLALTGTLGWYGSAPRPDWRAATGYLLDHSRPTDRSMFIGDWGRVVSHYARLAGREDDVPFRLWRGLDFTSPDVAAAVRAQAIETAADGHDLWLVVANDASPEVTTDPRLAGLWESFRLEGTVRFDRLLIVHLRPRGADGV